MAISTERSRHADCSSQDRSLRPARQSQVEVLQYFRGLFEVSEAKTKEELEAVHRLRYQVYCIENDFEPKEDNPGGLEIDSFDQRSVHSILTHRATRELIGTVRLVLPTGGPLPIQGLHPDPLALVKDRLPLETAAEVSRFAVSKSFRRRQGEERHADQNWEGPTSDNPSTPFRRLLPYLSIGLLQGVLRLSLNYNVTHLCAIIDPGLLRLLGRFGLHFHPIGEPVNYHGYRQPCFAQLSELLRTHAEEQPDIWALSTEGGELLTNQEPAESRQA